MDDLEIDSASVESNREKNSASNKPRYNDLVVIPVIPKPLAIFCLISNIFLPGSGTIVSALSVFCFYHKKETFQRMVVICMSNVVVGLCQLGSVMFLLIGWFWSIIWGCALVGHASHYEQNNRSLPTTIVVVPIEMPKSPHSPSKNGTDTLQGIQ